MEKLIRYWHGFLKVEKRINKSSLIFAWLRNSMSPEEIEGLKLAIEKYHPDLVLTVSKKNRTGIVERRKQHG